MMEDKGNIEIRGAYENNLKHIDVDIPKNRLVVLAGLSGSGKSSLAFDVIATESGREWQSTYPMFLRNKMPHYERPKVDSISNLTPSVVVDQRPLGNNSRSTVGTAVDVAPLMRLLFSRAGSPSAGGSMAYSPNHPAGMCPSCTGLGRRLILDEASLFDLDRSINEGGILFSQFSSGWQTVYWQQNPLLDPNKKLRDFTEDEWGILKYKAPGDVVLRINSVNTGGKWDIEYEGVVTRFEKLYMRRDISKLKKGLQDEIMSHVRDLPCPECGGTGLNPEALRSRIGDLNIVDMGDMPVRDLMPVLEGIDDPMGSPIARQISECLQRMVHVGIGYLSLSRRTDTLSGGENQRIKLVRNLGSSLTDITYILDEPTAGLHPADAERIGRILTGLRDNRNNVIVVEHSRQMISMADHIIEMGPGAGSDGGSVVYQGDLEGLMSKDTGTAECIRRKVSINRAPRPWSVGFEIRDAHCHNLKHVDVTVPEGVLTAVTGVAGSGKSSLICTELVSQHPDAIVVDQKPIGTSIRSTPATYVGIMDEIRRIFAEANGVDQGLFSFNSKGGCPICGGTGQITYDMAFAEPVVVVCEECGGRRYNREALGYRYNGRTIEEVMELTVSDAVDFFDSPKIRRKLKGLMDVGLGYLELGQPTSTLSGGEAQRVKLASELHKKGRLYILDEPSTGLHAKDIERLMRLLNGMVDAGNTVVMIEHRLESIAMADWIIDMGPEGGTDGGRVVFEGTPESIIGCESSKTGRFLREAME